MPKTLDEYFIDWEALVFRFGYGTGEKYTIPALYQLMELCPLEGSYDYRDLEAKLSPTVAWLLLDMLHHADIFDYGTSTRFAWFTPQGKALKYYLQTKTTEQLISLVCSTTEHYYYCYPNACNCGPDGFDPKAKCANPFWK